MTYCANYNQNICPIECYYAECTENLRRKMSVLYGTDACELTNKNYILNGTMNVLYGTDACELTNKNYILKGENNNGET